MAVIRSATKLCCSTVMCDVGVCHGDGGNVRLTSKIVYKANASDAAAVAVSVGGICVVRRACLLSMLTILTDS